MENSHSIKAAKWKYFFPSKPKKLLLQIKWDNGSCINQIGNDVFSDKIWATFSQAILGFTNKTQDNIH